MSDKCEICGGLLLACECCTTAHPPDAPSAALAAARDILLDHERAAIAERYGTPPHPSQVNKVVRDLRAFAADVDALIAAARAEEREAIVALALDWQRKQRELAAEAEIDGENHLRHMHDGAADILSALVSAVRARSPSSGTEAP